MGVDSKKAPPLPAPTETESTTATELATDVSLQADQKSSYSLPDDGTPVTIKTRGHKANRSQTSLLIEYFEGGKSGPSGSSGDRKPSVRVRLTPSKKNKNDHIQITETKSSRKASLSRRATVSPGTPSRLDRESHLEGEDSRSMSSYASATEESNVSRNPIDIEIDRGGRKRRPSSPLIPAADTSKAAYLPPDMSDISAIPTDSFLDGSGPSHSTRNNEGRRSHSPSRGEKLATGAVAAVASAAMADKMRSNKSRTASGERIVLPKSSEKLREKSDRKHRSSKSRTSSIEKHAEGTRSPRRRSSRSHGESLISAADSSMLSSNLSPSHRSLDQQSFRSGTSKSSINNPKLLETVEDAIRRLILPELSALKREQSKREGRRGSLTSTGTSVSREDISIDRRKSADKRVESTRDSVRTRERRDREARHDYADSSPRSADIESVEESSILDVDHSTPRRSSDRLKAAVAGAAVAGIAAAALNAKSPASDDRKQRRRRRADGSVRSRSLGREKYSQEFEDEEAPLPPMPLMSEVNASEVTRASILSADTDRPHSATEELTPVQEVSRGQGSFDSTPTPTRTPATLQKSLGLKHANISHGDLRELPRQGSEEYNEFETEEYDRKYPSQPHVEYDDEEEYEETNRANPAQVEPGFGYYNTQDVPPPLKYVPYQPERRGLSPIYSVSGYTEGGGSEAQRDSRVTHTSSSSPNKSRQDDAVMSSPGSIPSNIMGREFDQQSDRSLRSSGLDYRNTTYTDDSELDRVTSGQAVRGVGANPNIVHVPIGVESAVASLVDGSMLEQSVLTTGSGYDYGNRDSVASFDDRSKTYSGTQNLSPSKHSVESQRAYLEDREGTPTSSHKTRSREFAEEYDLDNYGRKVATSRYRHSPAASRHSPTESEAAITAGAVGAAAAALKAAQDRSRQPTVEETHEEHEEFVPEGVFRNKSFKQRTLEGREPANTPAHSIDRLDYEDHPKLGASGLPDLNDPMPEIGFVDDDLETNPSVIHEPLGGTDHGSRDHWPSTATPRHTEYITYDQDEEDHHKGGSHGLGLTGAAGAAAIATAAAMAHSHSRQASQEQDEEWQRTSADRKRDTLVTNPYDGASPIVNPDLLGGRGFDPDNYATGFHTGSPGGHKIDEGYISQGPVQSPHIQPKGKAVGFSNQTEDPFYVPNKGHTRHLSGMSQGMGSPIYDAATGAGIDRIESKDIIALMQHLMVRDAQRSARDTEILMTLVRSAAEMRNSFDDIKKLLASSEDVIIREVQENTEESVQNAIGGPRPYPGSAGRSAKGLSVGSQAGTVDDIPKKSSFFKKALKGLSTKGTNDLTRIEDMLIQLLTEVDTLKAQTARPEVHSGQGQSYENLQPEVQYEQDHGYEPEGNAGTSTASHASQSGHLSLQSRGPSTKGYERKFSDHRISTVDEAEEDDYDPEVDYHQAQHDLLTPGNHDQRGSSVPLATPPQPAVQAQNASLSNDNTPRTDKGKKHKSSNSTGWLGGKISRWSESTTTSFGKAFRGSGAYRKDKNDEEFLQRPHSRSGSDLGAYANDYQQDDQYDDDHLHSGFSQTDLPQTSQPQDLIPPRPSYMTPEDPKYKAHRNSLNLQHPQPRQGQTERFKVALETQAHEYDSPMSPRSADWAGSATSLHRFPGQNPNRYSAGSAATGGEYWASSPAGQSGPPRPPKEPLDSSGQTPAKPNRLSKLQKTSPLPFHSVESGYGTGPGTHAASTYTGSPKLENRNLSGALGVPTRRPSGPRAMTPKSAEEEAAREERRRKRDTFGTIASNDTDTF